MAGRQYMRQSAHGGTAALTGSAGEWKAARQAARLNGEATGQISSLASVKAPTMKAPSSRLGEGVRPVSRRLLTQNPRGHLYGTVVYYEDMELYSQAYWGEIDPVTGVITPIWYGSDLINGQDSDVQSGAVRDGILYTPTCQQDMSGSLVVKWNRRDLETGDVMTPIQFGTNDSAYAYSMCYDPEEDIFHILTLDPNTGSFGVYGQVDPRTWTVETFGKPTGGGYLGAIAYHPGDGQVYGVSDSNELYMIDQATHSLLMVSYIDDDYPLVTTNQTTAMVYSPLDGAFALHYRDINDLKMKLAYLDPETGEVTEGEPLAPGNPWVSCLWTPDAYATNEAPEMAPMPVVDFDGPSLEGSVTLTAPTYSFAGLRLADDAALAVKLVVDGETLFEKTLAPGATERVSLTLAQGVHQGRIECELDGESAPTRTFRFATGHDVPRTPSRLVARENVLTWQGVAPEGANGGYVEPSALAYNVYVDGTLQNAEPIADCTYTLDDSVDLARRTVGVTSVASGQESAPVTVSAVYGKAMTQPWSLKPTADEASLFQVVDANDDDSLFAYTQNQATGEWAFTLWLDRVRGNDWLFLPATSFDRDDILYSLSFLYSGSTPYETLENLSVYIGREPSPEAMTTLLYSHEDFMATYARTISAIFPMAETGVWYVGFHCHSNSADALGVSLSDFALTPLTDRSSAAPSAPAVKVASADKGELKAIVTLDLPTTDLTGKPLAATDLTAEVKCGDNVASVSGEAGKQVSVEVAVPGSGWNDIDVTLSNAAGKGLTHTHRAYVGLDKPGKPHSIVSTPSADNFSTKLTWKAPNNVGANGGYVDTDDLTYIIYQNTGAVFNEVGRTSDLEFVFTPYNSAVQDEYKIGPVASNAMGKSTTPDLPVENLGRPWAIPMVESFGGIFAYYPLHYTVARGFESSRWEALVHITSMGTGATVDCDKGCLAVYNESHTPTIGELVLPKATTSTAMACTFRLRWLDWAHTPVMSVWGRRNGHEELEELAVFEPKRPMAGTWRDEEVNLPAEYADCSWVELRVRAALTDDYDEVGFVDSYALVQNVEYDLKVASIDVPARMENGESAQALVTLLNAGTEAMSGRLEITLTDGDGKRVKEVSKQISRLLPNQNYLEYFDIDVLREYLDSGELTLTASVSSDDDQVPANDTMSATILLSAAMAPSVGDLTARWSEENGSAALLTWSEPDLSYGGFDGFEYQEPFAISEELGMWRNLDRDGREPFIVEGLTWSGNTLPSAWQPIDAVALGVQPGDRLYPHNGSTYLLARAISIDIMAGEEPVQAADWLISPEVVGGTQVTFWYNTLSNSYTEYVELWVSASDDDPESFRYVRTFSKEGDEEWEEVRFTLPADARHFALVYRSYDAFGAMLDDISFTPARLESWVVDHYSVVRSDDGGEPVEVGRVSDATSFLDTTAGDGGAVERYWVKTAVKAAGSHRYGPLSNAASLDRTSIDDLTELQGVTGGKGVIHVSGHEGETLSLYATDGRHLRQLTVPSAQALVGVEPGIYLVKCGNALAKVLVK